MIDRPLSPSPTFLSRTTTNHPPPPPPLRWPSSSRSVVKKGRSRRVTIESTSQVPNTWSRQEERGEENVDAIKRQRLELRLESPNGRRKEELTPRRDALTASDLQKRVARRPIYPRISLDHIDTATLQFYDLPWEYDWIIILREVDELGLTVPFEHTARLRRESPDLIRKEHDKTDTGLYRYRKADSPYDHANRRNQSEGRDREEYTVRKRERDPSPSREYREDVISDPFRPVRRAAGSISSKEIAWHEDDMDMDMSSEYSFVVDDDVEGEQFRDGAEDTFGTLKFGKKAPEEFDFTKFEVLPTNHMSPSSSRRIAATIVVKDNTPKPPITTSASYGPAVAPTMFKWLHLQQSYMNFQSFKDFVLHVASPPQGEQKGLLQLLDDVQSHEVKRRMEQCLKSSFDIPLNPTATSSDNAVLWVCFPYLNFKQHKLMKPPRDVWDHPNVALLQSYETVSHNNRELQQAVTKYTKSDKCFFISQLWCLVLNQHTIVTCAQSKADELRGDIVKVITALHPFGTDLKEQVNDSSPYIYVHDRGNCIYLLPVKRCQSWVEFLSQFVDLEPNSFHIYEDKIQVTAENWNEMRVAERAKTTQVSLKLVPVARENRPSTSYRSDDDETNDSSSQSSDDSSESSSQPSYEIVREKDNWEAREGTVLESIVEESERVEGDDMVEVIEGDEIQVASRVNRGQRQSPVEIVTNEAATQDSEQVQEGTDVCGRHPTEAERPVMQPASEYSGESLEEGFPLVSTERRFSLKPEFRGKEGRTRLPKRLVRKHVVEDLGYAFEDQKHFIVVLRALDKELINELLILSETSPEYLNLDLAADVRGQEHETVHEDAASEKKMTSSHQSIDESLLQHSWDTATDLQTFRVLTWMSVVSHLSADATIPSPPAISNAGKGVKAAHAPPEVDIMKLDGITHNMHEFLSKNRRAYDRSVYQRCARMTYSAFKTAYALDVERYEKERPSKATRVVEKMAVTRKTVRSFSKSACRLFQCFLPLQHDSEIAKTFWGALGNTISQILERSVQRDEDHAERTKKACDLFCQLSEVTSELTALFSEGRGPRPGSFKVPSVLYRSFLSIVILLADFRVDHKWGKKVFEITLTIEGGKKELLESFSSGSLTTCEAINPVGLLALFVYQLCGDESFGQEPSLLFDAYKTYLDSLEAEIQRNPRDRRHQVKLVYAKQELMAIISVISEQEQLLQTFSDVLGPKGTGWAAQLLRTPRSRASLIVERARASCNDRLSALRSLLWQAELILEDHTRLIETVKDIHESASLTFAIVSVIFLPLTAVASILGMNTVDVRDMSHNQWVFWAAGLPLAALTGLFCLWCTAQLDEFGIWAKDRWFKSKIYRELKWAWMSVKPGVEAEDREREKEMVGV